MGSDMYTWHLGHAYSSDDENERIRQAMAHGKAEGQRLERQRVLKIIQGLYVTHEDGSISAVDLIRLIGP